MLTDRDHMELYDWSCRLSHHFVSTSNGIFFSVQKSKMEDLKHIPVRHAGAVDVPLAQPRDTAARPPVVAVGVVSVAVVVHLLAQIPGQN